MIRSMLGIALCCLVCAAGATRLSASAECFATIATGNGAAFFSVCLSDHGNVINFETPQGYDQAISGDGYVLCSTERLLATTHGWDAGGFGEEGFGPVLLWDDSNDDPPQGPAYGVGLTALSYGVRHRVVVEDHDDWNPADSDGPQRAEGCLPIPKNNTPYLGLRDLQGRVTYELGTIGAGRSSRVSFLYRHF